MFRKHSVDYDENKTGWTYAFEIRYKLKNLHIFRSHQKASKSVWMRGHNDDWNNQMVRISVYVRAFKSSETSCSISNIVEHWVVFYAPLNSNGIDVEARVVRHQRFQWVYQYGSCRSRRSRCFEHQINGFPLISVKYWHNRLLKVPNKQRRTHENVRKHCFVIQLKVWANPETLFLKEHTFLGI